MYRYDAGWCDPHILLEIGTTDHGQLLVIDEFHRSKSHVDEAINCYGESETEGTDLLRVGFRDSHLEVAVLGDLVVDNSKGET